MGTIDKGIPRAKDKDKDQTKIHDSPNKNVSDRVVSDSEEPTELGLVCDEIHNPWWPDDDENNVAPSEV
jgi:hypothetical protein